MGRAIPLIGILTILTGCRANVPTDTSETDASVIWLTYTETDIPFYPEVALLKVYLAFLRSPEPELTVFAESALDTFPLDRVLSWVKQEAILERGTSPFHMELKNFSDRGACQETRIRGSGFGALHLLKTCIGKVKIVPYRPPGPTYPGIYSARGQFVATLYSPAVMLPFVRQI